MLIVQFIRIQVVINKNKMSQRLQPHSSWQMHCIRRITTHELQGCYWRGHIFTVDIITVIFNIFLFFILLFKKI